MKTFSLTNYFKWHKKLFLGKYFSDNSFSQNKWSLRLYLFQEKYFSGKYFSYFSVFGGEKCFLWENIFFPHSQILHCFGENDFLFSQRGNHFPSKWKQNCPWEEKYFPWERKLIVGHRHRPPVTSHRRLPDATKSAVAEHQKIFSETIFKF